MEGRRSRETVDVTRDLLYLFKTSKWGVEHTTSSRTPHVRRLRPDSTHSGARSDPGQAERGASTVGRSGGIKVIFAGKSKPGRGGTRATVGGFGGVVPRETAGSPPLANNVSGRAAFPTAWNLLPLLEVEGKTRWNRRNAGLLWSRRRRNSECSRCGGGGGEIRNAPVGVDEGIRMETHKNLMQYAGRDQNLMGAEVVTRIFYGSG